jgi:hypothetical protein
LTARQLWFRAGRLIRDDAAVFALLMAWALAPLIALAAYVTVNGGVLTGTNGADFFDQFQYLAWIRDEGSHILASNLWMIGSTPHDYVQPMYLISGLLWRLGLGLQLAYVVWTPVAVVVLFSGYAVYVRSHLRGRLAVVAALSVALFYESPVLALATWTGHLSALHRYQLVLTTDDATSALNLWGFAHAAIALGLMGVFLVAVERLLTAAQARGRIDPGHTAVAAVSGLLVAWLHPWQAVTLLLLVGAVWVLAPSRRRLAVLVIPVVATVLPLLYGVILARFDPSWSSFQRQSTITGTGPGWALLASFAPLLVLAALGVRRPRGDGEWMLLLWLLACAAVYFVLPQFPPHALAGVTLPLAILAVRGWGRLREAVAPPRPVAVALAVALILLMSIPAAVFHALGVRDDLVANVGGGLAQQEFRLTANQAAALSYLSRARRPGGVLAPWLLSMSIPGFTGRPVFAGHPQWQPHANVGITSTFFDPGVPDPTGALHRAILTRSGAVFVVADCHESGWLTRDLAPLARPVKRFGCETVYATR